VFIFVAVYSVIDSVRKLLDTPSYHARKYTVNSDEIKGNILHHSLQNLFSLVCSQRTSAEKYAYINNRKCPFFASVLLKIKCSKDERKRTHSPIV